MQKLLSIIIFILLCPFLAHPGFCAANSTDSAEEKSITNEPQQKSKEDKNNIKENMGNEEKKDTNTYESQYYTVTLPPGWTAVTPPTENQGTVTSIFKSTSGSIVIMLILGNLGGADLKTITDMFAEQFKATKEPIQKNGQYIFSFLRDGKSCDAYVSREDDIFMVTTITGNKKDALDFIRHQIKSPNYSKLLPQ